MSLDKYKQLYSQLVELRLSGHLDKFHRLALKLTKKFPGQALVWTELAASYALRYDFERSRTKLEKSLKLGKSKPLIFLNAAQVMIGCRWEAEAERILRLYLTRHPDNPEVKAALAATLEKQNKTDEAEEIVREALSKNPNSSKAKLVLATLLKRQKKAEEALALLEKLIHETAPTATTKETLYRAHYCRMQCYDDIARYPEAISAFHDTVSYIRKQHGDSLPILRHAWTQKGQAMNHFNQHLKQTQIEEWQAQTPHTEQEVCFLSGHPRSGTTLVGSILASHPDIAQVDEREIFYRNSFTALLSEFKQGTLDIDRLQNASSAQLKKHSQAYFDTAQKLFPDTAGHTQFLDKNPLNITMIPGAIRLFPNAKHLVVLRDPRAVSLSCLLVSPGLSLYSVNWLDPKTAAASYTKMMECWKIMSDWQLPNIHAIRYEDLIADQENQTRALAQSLNLSWDDTLLNYQEKARNQAASSPTYEQVTRPIYKTSIDKWRHYENLLEPAMPILEKAAKRMGY